MEVFSSLFLTVSVSVSVCLPLFLSLQTFTMLFLAYNMNHIRLSDIMPVFQQMQDEPEFLQQERHRLDTDGLPLPDSSGGATEYHLPVSFPGENRRL